MGRRILFITTDQQRFDALGCNGGTVARTPVVDQLAASGINYQRAHPQNVVCMPSRSTMITGQYVSTHGVWMNGVPLPTTAPSIAHTLRQAGYKTSLIGKAHFEPFLDPFLRFIENRLSFNRQNNAHTENFEGVEDLHRGFDHFEFATHGVAGPLHFAQWFRENYPELVNEFYSVLDGDLEVNATGGGDTGAPQVKHNNTPRETYHTDWVADRTISWLDSLNPDDDWFCWMSFPDPHHPWDPPASELGRVNWRDVDLPDGYIADASERERVLSTKPQHWMRWYDGTFVSNYEAPARWVPATLTADQIREVNAMTHIENELVDEAIGRVLAAIDQRGWSNDLDVIYTTDHGEFQGDYGFLFKGPYHVDSLMRLPLIWRPAPSAQIPPSTVDAPVGLISLAATFASIAGLPEPEYVEASALPTSNEDAYEKGHERVLTEWDSSLFGKIVSSRTIHRDGWTCTTYAPGTLHNGTEGELYNTQNDPHQLVNLWNDPAYISLQKDLCDDLRAHLPTPTEPRRHCEAPV
jgi:arylsulfatase A-like enzyme